MHSCRQGREGKLHSCNMQLIKGAGDAISHCILHQPFLPRFGKQLCYPSPNGFTNSWKQNCACFPHWLILTYIFFSFVIFPVVSDSCLHLVLGIAKANYQSVNYKKGQVYLSRTLVIFLFLYKKMELCTGWYSRHPYSSLPEWTNAYILSYLL